MERVTISVSDEFTAELTAFMTANGYTNRSEAMRDLARLGLERARAETGVAGACLATLVYVFNHHTRELAKRLTDTHHGRHDLEVATLHVHLDAENCLEVAVLRGDAHEVRGFAHAVIAERGVQHGQVCFVPQTAPPHGDSYSHADENGHHHVKATGAKAASRRRGPASR
jgi:CopG family nickel-responsive transcriptional regulator